MFLPRKEINTFVGISIAAFVLKNRVQSSGYKFDVEGVADMQRAIKSGAQPRRRAGRRSRQDRCIRILCRGRTGRARGAAARSRQADASDPIERYSSRPDFQVVIYPGKSHLIHPVAGSPPAFMSAGYDDRPDISVGLAEAYLRFMKAGVQAELHIYGFIK